MQRQLSPGGLPTTDDLQAFKQRIYDQINKSGLVSVLKSQLRSKLIDSLTSQPAPASNASLASDTEYVMALLVCNFLSWHSLGSTLSVLDAELGIPGIASTAATLNDTARALRARYSSPALEEAVQHYHRQGLQQESFAAFLLGRLLQLAVPRPAVDGSCQTEERSGGTLRERLQSLDEQYSRLDGQPVVPGRSHSAGAELGPDKQQLQEQEQQEARLELAAEWERLQRWQQQQQQSMRAKEEAAQQRVRAQQREVERVAFEHRQTLLQEQARLLAWQANCQHAYQQQKNQLEEMETGIASRVRALAEKEAAAEQQVLAAVQLVEQMQADCQAALEQEKQAHQAALVHCKEQMQAKLLKATAGMERMEHQLEQVEGTNQALTVDSKVAQARANDLDKLVAKLEQQLQQSKQQLTAVEHKLELQQQAMHAAVSEGQRQLAEQKQLLDAKKSMSTDNEQLVHTIRSLQTEVRMLQQRVLQYEQQLASYHARLQQTDDFLDEAVAAKESALQRVEKLTLAAEDLEGENQHLRSKLAALRSEAVAVRLQSRPASPSWGPLSGRALAWSGPVSPSGPTAHQAASPPALPAAVAVGAAGGARRGVLVRSPTAGHRLHELAHQESMLRAEHASFRERIASQRKQADAALAAIRDHLSVQPLSPTHGGLVLQPPLLGYAGSPQAWLPQQQGQQPVAVHSSQPGYQFSPEPFSHPGYLFSNVGSVPMASMHTEPGWNMSASAPAAVTAAAAVALGSSTVHLQPATLAQAPQPSHPQLAAPPAASSGPLMWRVDAVPSAVQHAAMAARAGSAHQLAVHSPRAASSSRADNTASSPPHAPANNLLHPDSATTTNTVHTASSSSPTDCVAPSGTPSHHPAAFPALSQLCPAIAQQQMPAPADSYAAAKAPAPPPATASDLLGHSGRHPDKDDTDGTGGFAAVTLASDPAGLVSRLQDAAADEQQTTAVPVGTSTTISRPAGSSSSSSSSRSSSASRRSSRDSTSASAHGVVLRSTAVQQHAAGDLMKERSLAPSHASSLASSAAAPAQPQLQPESSSASDVPQVPADASLADSLLHDEGPLQSWHLPGLSSNDDEDTTLEAPGYGGHMEGQATVVTAAAPRVSSSQHPSSFTSSMADEQLETALESDELENMHVPMGEDSGNSVF